MTDRLAYVYADLEGTPHLVGRLSAPSPGLTARTRCFRPGEPEAAL